MIVLGLVLSGLGAALLGIQFKCNKKNPTVAAGLVLLTSSGLSLLMGGTASVLLLGADLLLLVITWQVARTQRLGLVWVAVLILGLLVTKLPPLQNIVGPATWIGISYLIFRLVHVTLDGRRGKFCNITLTETVVYALHPAALIAGPIDRIQPNVAYQRQPSPDVSAAMNTGLWRLFIGLVKKLVLVNILAKVISVYNMAAWPDQPTGNGWIWLICYSFYIYLDFASYSDLAIGSALLMGISLPENFANPYLQPDITRFWQAWHITLSTWLRDYIFFPLSRTLCKRFNGRFSRPILLVSHLATMIACGLWHGLAPGYVVWGVWHGLALFAHSQIAVLRRRFSLPTLPRAMSIAFTFSFVSLGWVFFAAGFSSGMKILARLFGLG